MRRISLNERQRTFANEVGGVVLGVLIALGLGAIATEIGWRIEVRNARHAMEAELGEVIGQGMERERVAPCIERRLDQLATIIDKAASDRRLPPIGEIAFPPYRTWTRGVWDSMISAQTAAHFDRDDLDNFSGTYEFVTLLQRHNAREAEVWTRLYTIVGPGRELGVEEAATLRQNVSDARMLTRLMGGLAVRMKQTAEREGLDYDVGTARAYSVQRGGYPVCRPIDPVIPPTYGQAPFKGFIERARSIPPTPK